MQGAAFSIPRSVQVVSAELVALLPAGPALSVPLPCRNGLEHEERKPRTYQENTSTLSRRCHWPHPPVGLAAPALRLAQTVDLFTNSAGSHSCFRNSMLIIQHGVYTSE